MRTKTRIGASACGSVESAAYRAVTGRESFLPRIASLLLAGALIAGLPPRSGASDKNKDRDYSVVAGTVFREPGFALPGSEVVLTPAPDSAVKLKKMSFITNHRGEFAFRVPSAKAVYSVAATAKGFKGQQKTVEVDPSGRFEVTFMLQRESNQ